MINWLNYFNRSILMTYKHKMLAVDSNAKIVSSADFDFYIVEVMLYNACLMFANITFLYELKKLMLICGHILSRILAFFDVLNFFLWD